MDIKSRLDLTQIFCDLDDFYKAFQQYSQSLPLLTSSVGDKQIINKPTHPVNNSFSCIDLIFCDNLNMSSNYGADLSVFEKCHHNTVKPR